MVLTSSQADTECAVCSWISLAKSSIGRVVPSQSALGGSSLETLDAWRRSQAARIKSVDNDTRPKGVVGELSQNLIGV